VKRDLRMTIISLLIVSMTLILSAQSFGQNNAPGGGGGETVSSANQAGFFISRLLPNGVSERDEIMQLWGLRYSYAMNAGSYIDFGGIMGSEYGVDWMGLSAGISMHIPIETLIGHAGLGADVTRYETPQTDTQNEIGIHFIGGVMSRIGGGTHARFDMKLGSKPGAYLLFAVGLSFEFAPSGGGGGD
jgi:hypothetical protein